MTPDPKTHAQRLARVFRILAVLAERGPFDRLAREAAWYARAADDVKYPERLDLAEKFATAACRAAGIDPKSIQ